MYSNNSITMFQKQITIMVWKFNQLLIYVTSYYYQLFILMKSFQNHISNVSISTFILVMCK